ncbi:MAG: hypothetical protein R2786_05955 [Flavobacteriaceae bacterium]
MEKEFYLLELILKKHKISYQINKQNQSIEIGKYSGNNFTIILYFILALISLSILVYFQFGSLFLYLIPISSFLFGMNKLIGSRKANEYSKTISQNGITLFNKEGAITLDKSKIKAIESNVFFDDPSGSEGDLNLITNNDKTYLLFNLTNKNVKYLKDDLENLKRIISQILNL